MNKKRLKKGVALEMTMVMMMTLFAFSTLIFTATFRESIRDAYLNTNIKLVQDIEEIGDSFYYQIANNYSDIPNENELLDIIVLKDVFINNEKLTKTKSYKKISTLEYYTLEVINEKDEENVLYLKVTVMVNTDTKNIKVSEWYFNNPINDSKYIEEFEKEYVK